MVNGKIFEIKCNAYSADDGLVGIPVSNSTLKKASGAGIKSSLGSLITSATSQLSGVAGSAVGAGINSMSTGTAYSEPVISIPSSKIILQFN